MNLLEPAGLALVIVAGVILIVIIFFFSYFNTLMLIAGFTYPNAKIKATGTPFISRSRLRKLVESGTREEFVEALRSEGYSISSAETDVKKMEGAINRELFDTLVETLFSLPKGAKPFFEAYMWRYDAEAIKRMMRAKKMHRNPNPEEMKLFHLDRKVLEDMVEADTVEDAKACLQGTEFHKAAEETSDFHFESALDRAVFEKINESVYAVDGDVARKIKRFVGALIDIINIKTTLRGKEMGLNGETIMSSLLPEGREVAEWRLKNMAEAADTSSALAELSGTSYGEAMKGISTAEAAERALDAELLKLAEYMAMEGSLDIGPAIFFFVSKEIEARNIRAVNLAIEYGKSWEDIEELLVMEVD